MVTLEDLVTQDFLPILVYQATQDLVHIREGQVIPGKADQVIQDKLDTQDIQESKEYLGTQVNLV